MVTNIRTISSNTFYPYFNLALEKYLFDTVDDDTVILYLWQNEKTVVYGCDQNAREELLISRLIDDGGYPARCLSDSRAVFHDKGNLNFTFIAKKDNYDVDKQLEVITKACRLLGLTAEKNGQNNLTIRGRRFSDNAFYRSGDRRYHHGTLLVNADPDRISAYLNTDRSRLLPREADSTEEETANLADFCPDLDIETLRRKMFEAFEHVYGLKASPISGTELDPGVIMSYEKLFSDDEWLYG